MPASPMHSISSNFSSYTCDDFAKTAARVVEELRAESIDADDDFYSFCERNVKRENGLNEESEDQLIKGSNGVEESTEKEVKCNEIKGEKEEIVKSEVEKEEDFEFPLVMSLPGSSPAMADEIFCNGKIRPTYSFSLDNLQFDREGLLPPVPPVRQPLRLLFLEETESPSSCSSSLEYDELNDLPPESYCMVERKTAAVKEDDQCKKSKWTKSRWRLKNFLNRSSSDGGKGRSIFPTSDESHHYGRRRKGKFEKSKLYSDSHGSGHSG